METKAMQFILQKGGCSMKRPTNILALRAELCKALRNSISEYGYDEKDELHFANRDLHNAISVCDECGEKDICFIEIMEDKVRFWIPCIYNQVDLVWSMDYRYSGGNKTEFFMTCVGLMYRAINE